MRKPKSLHYTDTDAFDAVMRSELLSWEEKKVYAALASYANGGSSCQRAYATIATRTNLDKETVTLAIRALARYGLIEIQHVPQKANVYYLLEIPAIFLDAPLTAEKSTLSVEMPQSFVVRGKPVRVLTA